MWSWLAQADHQSDLRIQIDEDSLCHNIEVMRALRKG